MINQKGVKISLLICLSIILILSIVVLVLSIVGLTLIDHVDAKVDGKTDKDAKDKLRIVLIVIIVIVAIDIIIQILGIVAISRDHYCGSLAFTIYQGISLLFVVFDLITDFAITEIFSLLIKIIIIALCIIYVRKLRQNQSNNPY